MKTVCIYHSIDLDGWMSAAIVKLMHNKQEQNKETYSQESENLSDISIIDFIGYNYGQPIPDLSEYECVIMCDISFPKETMEKLFNILDTNLIWIDHHISAFKDIIGEEFLKDKIDLSTKYNGLRDLRFAACELTWQYFFPNETIPEIVRLLGRYDCFGHKQVWKPVVGYEGLYEVSNHGNVRSLDRIIIENNTNKERPIKGIDLSIANSKRGYRVVVLCKDGTEKMRNVHQLVAESFIPNIESKPCINHKDFNRLNNYVENLEWCTYLENNEHSIKEGQRGKKVFQMDSEYNVISEFDSIIEADKQTGIQSQNIGKVCRGERETAGGFKWEYNLEKTCAKQFVPQDEETKVLEFQYGARQCISNYEEAYEVLLDNLFEKGTIGQLTSIEKIHRQGKAIYSFLCTDAKQSYKNGFELPFYIIGQKDGLDAYETYKFICVNKERFNPINFGIDYHADGYDGAACFHIDSNGMFCFSLYNDNGLVDCSLIAKQYGGGGHKSAAGFRIDKKEFFNNWK